ncbi:MAG: AMP-binding protein, partial [Mycobacteriaceae bacterium]
MKSLLPQSLTRPPAHGDLRGATDTAKASPAPSLSRGELRPRPDAGRSDTCSPGAAYYGGPAPRPRTLIDVLQVTAATFPTAAAIDDGCSVLDYSALLGEIDEFGERLGAQGIGRGDRVGVRVPSGTADLYVTILAILSVGAAYVPIDVDDPDGRAEQVWSEAGVCA